MFLRCPQFFYSVSRSTITSGDVNKSGSHKRCQREPGYIFFLALPPLHTYQYRSYNNLRNFHSFTANLSAHVKGNGGTDARNKSSFLFPRLPPFHDIRNHVFPKTREKRYFEFETLYLRLSATSRFQLALFVVLLLSSNLFRNRLFS